MVQNVFQALKDIKISSWSFLVKSHEDWFLSGATGGIRTPDPRLRRCCVFQIMYFFRIFFTFYKKILYIMFILYTFFSS